MKKVLFSLMVMLIMSISANAMTFTQAQREALFLTDKMAYELNLTQEQYDAAYEINLDYLMGVTGVDDVYGTYWTRRNMDLSYILYDWQWSAFRAASYFYRPLYWDAGFWHFGVYARYPYRSYFYFDRPGVYVSYRGGHSWHMNGGRSWYHERMNDFRGRPDNHLGMRDRFNRGDFNRASDRNFNRGSNGIFNRNSNREMNRGLNNNGGNQDFNRNRRDVGRGSSTRVTVKDNNFSRGGSFGSNRPNSTIPNNRGSFGSNRQTQNVQSRSGGSIGSNSKNGSSFGGGNHNGASFGGSNRNGSSFGGGNNGRSGGDHFGGGFGSRR